MSPEPFDSLAKAPPAKRWEKGYGDENDADFVPVTRSSPKEHLWEARREFHGQ